VFRSLSRPGLRYPRRFRGLGPLSGEDDGLGIPLDQRQTVFKPSATSKRAGTGLGLAICRKIVEEHGGMIDIESSRLGGTRFLIRLPVGPGSREIR
jgi:signal transduction histidine kinase